jgi:hypothetical protein
MFKLTRLPSPPSSPEITTASGTAVRHAEADIFRADSAVCRSWVGFSWSGELTALSVSSVEWAPSVASALNLYSYMTCLFPLSALRTQPHKAGNGTRILEFLLVPFPLVVFGTETACGLHGELSAPSVRIDSDLYKY